MNKRSKSRPMPVECITSEERDKKLLCGDEVKVRFMEGGTIFLAKMNSQKNRIDFTPYVDEVTAARRIKQSENVLKDIESLFD